MSNIKVLSTELKNRIAAGEVVERPASVVRELIENSIDAGATDIKVEIEQAGRKLIRISDNGKGMDGQDAVMCIQRHATSKLLDEDGLYNISTMGFRGEALPSIASISRLTITTALRGQSTGVTLEVLDGKVHKTTPCAAIGTTIEVRDLFYNTPARRKFLKRDSTEQMHIIDAVTRLGMSHPEVGFTLYVNAQETMTLPPAGTFKERLAQVYGSEFLEDLIEFTVGEPGFGLTGFVSKLVSLRESRTNQYVFINTRPIKDPSLAHAVYGAYDGISPSGLHPVFFIFLDLDPHGLDFNVHPAKREVRFQHKDTVYKFLRRSVLAAIRTDSDYKEQESQYDEVNVEPQNYSTQNAHADSGTYVVAGGDTFSVSEPMRMDFVSDLSFVYIGETFVAYTDGGGLKVLDHHAAHERVLYEKLLSGLKVDSHRLLFPRQIELSVKEHMIVVDNLDVLSEVGVEVEDFGGDSVIIRALPMELEEADMRGILADASAAISEGQKPGKTLRQEVAARIACHSSIRGKRVLGSEEFNALLRALDETEDPHHCPHGRPTRLNFTLDDLQKMFKRK